MNALELLSPVLLAGFAWIAVRLERFIKARTDNAYLEGVLVRANEAVWVTIKDLQRNTVEEIKAANADGKLTDEEKKRIKDKALADVKALLGAGGLKMLFKIFGGEDAATAFLSSKIEASVKDLRDAEKK